jgi:hypothetical protein
MTISIESEIPETLHTAVTAFIESHVEWNTERIMTAALTLFLHQLQQVERDGD